MEKNYLLSVSIATPTEERYRPCIQVVRMFFVLVSFSFPLSEQNASLSITVSDKYGQPFHGVNVVAIGMVPGITRIHWLTAFDNIFLFHSGESSP